MTQSADRHPWNPRCSLSPVRASEMLGHNIHSQSFHPNLGGPGHDGPTWRGTKIEVRGPDHKTSKGLAKYKRGFTQHPKATSIGRVGGSQGSQVGGDTGSTRPITGRRMGLQSPLPSPRQASEAPRHWLLPNSHEQMASHHSACLPLGKDQPKTTQKFLYQNV